MWHFPSKRKETFLTRIFLGVSASTVIQPTSFIHGGDGGHPQPLMTAKLVAYLLNTAAVECKSGASLLFLFFFCLLAFLGLRSHPFALLQPFLSPHQASSSFQRPINNSLLQTDTMNTKSHILPGTVIKADGRTRGHWSYWRPYVRDMRGSFQAVGTKGLLSLKSIGNIKTVDKFWDRQWI